MEKKYQDSLDKLQHYLDNMTPEQEAEAKEFFRDGRPNGWNELSEDNLPIVDALSTIDQGGKYIRMLHKNGSEDTIWVGADTYAWWMIVGQHETGYTHWYK